MSKKVPYNDPNMDEWNEKYGKLRAYWIGQTIPKSGKLLDIAGYHGDLKNYISKDVEYYLIDLFAPEGKNFARFDLNDLGKLPFDDKTFDMIVAIDAFEHIKKPFILIDEIRRILKDDGLFITSRHLIPTERHYIELTEVFFEDWKIEHRESITEANLKVGEVLHTTLVKSDNPSEIFYWLRK